jgi:hypothetical protein
VNRSPRPSEGQPLPPYPWLGLSAAVAAPLLFLVVGREAGLFWGFAIPVGAGASVPVGFVLLAVTAFPLMMPPDVRYLAAVVSVVLTCLLALPLVPHVGLSLVPVIVVLFLVWVTNHPTLIRGLLNPDGHDDPQDPNDSRSPQRPDDPQGPDDSQRPGEHR